MALQKRPKVLRNGRRKSVRGSTHKFTRTLKDALKESPRARRFVVPRPNQHPTNPMSQCETCPRKTQADMLVEYKGRFCCDACWTTLRRKGLL